MKSHQICTALLLPGHWFSRPDINPFPASIACPGLSFSGVALLSGFASTQLVGGSIEASQKTPWGYRVPAWIMPLEEETCTKICETAPKTPHRITTEMCWDSLCPVIQGECYHLPCQPWWWHSPSWGNFALSDAKAESGLWMHYRLI